MTPEGEGNIGIDRLKDHYKHCIRLSASNKINPKNAFDLQLIDYMQELLSEGQVNFKIASSALDVGAKIYSNRVDCIQSEAHKVASSILMALDGQQNKNSNNPDDTQLNNTSANSDGLNDSCGGDQQDAQTKANKKKRPNRSRNVKTLVEDDNLLDAKLEKNVIGDALMDSLSQDYDMSCPAALISYNALTQPRCLITIESSHMRKDYKEDKQGRPGTPSVKTLTTIVEEGGEDEVEKDKEDSTKIDSEHNIPDEDQDGDSIMRDETHQPSSTASTGQTSSTLPNCSNNLYNLVTLVTKNLNCAQVIRNSQTYSICPRLENFLFNDRTTTISGLNSNLDDSKVDQIDDPAPVPNLNTSSGGAHEFNPELYNGADDSCGDNHFEDACSDAGDVENKPENIIRDDVIPDLDKIAASKPTDYGYSNDHHRLLNTWAGPHAWKAMKAPLTSKKEAPKSARKRIKMEQKPIDFSEEFLADLEEIADKDIRHSSDVIKRWKKPLLPQDHNLTEEVIRTTLFRTFLRPEDTYHCAKSPADALKLVDNDHDYSKNDRSIDTDYGAPMSPALGGFDDVHDDSDDEFRANPIVEGNEVAVYGAPINNTLAEQVDLEFAGEHLIEQPYTVAQVNIPFAKIAKKMDVRKLKRVMWDLLLPPEKRIELEANKAAEGTGEQNTIVENGNSTMAASGDELNQTVIMNGDSSAGVTTIIETSKKTPSPTPSESAVHLQFSNLYGELPVRVSSKMASDLSQPIAFVTLLHLANEKNLKLIPNQDLKDFMIEQDEVI